MSDIDLARELMRAAERDHSALRGMSDPDVFADEIFGFHVQQAAEKLFKAWLAVKGEAYPHSHDLAALLDMLGRSEPDVVRFDGLVDYTRYAVRLRYSDADPGSSTLGRPQAVAQVDALFAAVQRRLADAGAD